MIKNRMKTRNRDDIKAALIYDFDGTLAEGNCAEHGLLPSLEITNAKVFWDRVKEETKNRDADEILTYLGCLALQARMVKKREELTPAKLQLHGATIPLFPGVSGWFDRINRYAKEQNVQLQHYVVSSGITEMILGTPIAEHFTHIFGCKFHYDKGTGYVKWPAVSINYTTKTQYIFQINKGILNYYDDSKVNEYIEHDQRPVPFERMVYLGDGDTDIPCMRLVKDQGGCSIAVFDEKKWDQASSQSKIEKLIAEDRVNYVVPGRYDNGSQLDITVKGIVRKISRKGKF